MPTQEEVKHFRNPYPTTDIIIEYDNGSKQGIVLIDRKNPPYGKALPGGFAEWGISLEDNARKEAMEETGLEILLESPEKPFCVHSDPSRDPRAHIISITYIAQGKGTLKAGDDALRANLYTIDEVARMVENDALAFDHARILGKYLEYRGYTRRN